jgi:transcriptional regulator with XRE-family HTH domain
MKYPKHTKLKWFLITMGISQKKALDKMTTLSNKPVTRYLFTELCNGKRENATIDTIQKIASALDIEVQQLLPINEKISKREFKKQNLRYQ